MDTVLISFIIPLYNCCEYIDRCIRSIENQQIRGGYEIVIIDDGSTDGSGEVVSKAQQKNSNIKLVRQQNYGVSCARNLGLDIASGRFIYFVDADDLLVDNSMMCQLTIMQEYDLDVMYVGIRHANHVNYQQLSVAMPIYHQFDRNIFDGAQFMCHTNLLRDIHQGPWAFIYNRKFLNRIGVRFDQNVRIAEDYVFNIDAISQAKRIAVSRIETYVYVYYPESSCHRHREYSEVSEIGLNLLRAFVNVCERHSAVLKPMHEVVAAYQDYIVFGYILWPMIRECASLSVARAMIKKLRSQGLYPISKPSHYDGTHMRYNRLLNSLWYASRHYSIWLLLIFLNSLRKSTNGYSFRFRLR